MSQSRVWTKATLIPTPAPNYEDINLWELDTAIATTVLHQNQLKNVTLKGSPLVIVTINYDP